MKTSTLAAIAAATFVVATSATLPVFASDWTDANGNEYTALEYIKGTSGPCVITDFKQMHYDVLKKRVCQLKDSEEGRRIMCKAVEEFAERRAAEAKANNQYQLGIGNIGTGNTFTIPHFTTALKGKPKATCRAMCAAGRLALSRKP